MPVVAPRSSASLPARSDGNVQTDMAGKSATIEPVRGRSNGGQASPVAVRTQDGKKPDKPEKPPKTSVLQRLGLGRLSGRSKPKLPPKPEAIKCRTPPPASPPPPIPSQLPASPAGPAQTDGRPLVTSTPVAGPRTISPVPAPVASPVVGQSSPGAVPTPVAGQGKTAPSPVASPESCQSPVEQLASKAEFHAPPSPAVRAKTLSLPRTAEIKLDQHARRVQRGRHGQSDGYDQSGQYVSSPSPPALADRPPSRRCRLRPCAHRPRRPGPG